MSMPSKQTKTMDDTPISMVQECCSAYNVTERPEAGVKITIEVPKRFKNLWLVRLSEMTTSEREIQDYEGDTV